MRKAGSLTLGKSKTFIMHGSVIFDEFLPTKQSLNSSVFSCTFQKMCSVGISFNTNSLKIENKTNFPSNRALNNVTDSCVLDKCRFYIFDKQII